ncbi:MAG: hypothetical protein H7Z10_14515 [Gemmatimonadaceae bacterium]|nr:hypothetical protein [Acetobacteraceae bacterium]
MLVSCPTPGLLSEAVDLTRYREAAQPDLTNLMLDARLVGIENGRCSRARDDRSVVVQFGVTVTAERGPAAGAGRSQNIPLVVGVTDPQGRLLNRQTFTQAVSFPANSTRTRVTSDPIELVLPVSAGRRGSDYGIVVGFLLTEPELAANRRRGPR